MSSGVIVTTWSWPSSIASRVNSMNAATSEPRKFSPSPRPTTSGELRRAPTTTSGWAASQITSVKAPSSRRHTARTASDRSSVCSSSSCSRCATVSVSVSEISSWPAASSPARSAAKFSMMPLWTTAMRPVWSRCGCALRSLGAPCVAQRVCPMPVWATGSGWASSSASRLTSLPAFLADSDRALVDESDAAGVVSAVLKTPQTTHDNVQRRALSDISDDSTHSVQTTGAERGLRPAGEPRGDRVHPSYEAGGRMAA